MCIIIFISISVCKCHDYNYFVSLIVTTTGGSLTRSPNTTVFTSDQLTLTCTTVLSSCVDTPIQVTHNWRGPSGVVTTGGNRTISRVTGSNLQYSSTLSFSSLHSSDSGTYTCTSTVNPDSLSVFVVPSPIRSISISFNTGQIYIFYATS